MGSHSLLQVSSRPSDWTWVSCIAGRFFTVWATREPTLGLLNLNRLVWGDKILASGRSQMWNPILILTFLFIEIKTEPRSEVRVIVQGHFKAVLNTLGSAVGVRNWCEQTTLVTFTSTPNGSLKHLTNGQCHLPVISVSLCHPRWQHSQDGWDEPTPPCKFNSLIATLLQTEILSALETSHLVSSWQLWLEQHALTRGSSKRPKMNLKEAKWPLTNKKTQANKPRKLMRWKWAAQENQ